MVVRSRTGSLLLVFFAMVLLCQLNEHDEYEFLNFCGKKKKNKTNFGFLAQGRICAAGRRLHTRERAWGLRIAKFSRIVIRLLFCCQRSPCTSLTRLAQVRRSLKSFEWIQSGEIHVIRMFGICEVVAMLLIFGVSEMDNELSTYRKFPIKHRPPMCQPKA